MSSRMNFSAGFLRRHLLLKINMLKTILISFLCFVSLTGCGKRSIAPDKNSATDRSVFAMDTFMTMRAYGEDGGAALEKAEKRITELESLFSVTMENSDIQRINSANGISVSVSEETAELIGEAVRFGDETDGALDITLYSVLREWGFTEDEFHVPDADSIAGSLEYVDYSRVLVDVQTVTLPAGFQIDLGALAKGYTSDAVIDILRENGVDSAVISLGGNVQTLGRKPDGSRWKIAVRDPFAPESDMCVLETGETAVVTSGSYERFFIGDDGKKYWHILDPSDGYPADNGLVSVTVIGKSGLYCDAMSTALFVMGKERAVEFWSKNKNFDMILVTDSKEIFYTKSKEYAFENLTEMSAEVLGDN